MYASLCRLIRYDKPTESIFELRHYFDCSFSLSYKYLKILGLNIKEKMPRPTTNNQSAGDQWFILNRKPRLLIENDNAPVINANFFICAVYFMVSSLQFFIKVKMFIFTNMNILIKLF
jgi:hypothetical protein